MSKQESMGDWFQMAKDYAKAEKGLKIERWVYISIEYKDEGKLEPVRLFSYNLPREVYERRRWVIRWRLSKLQCQYPKQYVECFHSYYDRRSGESLGFESCLSKLISAKAQVTKAERTMLDYIERNRQNNLFFDETTDEDLVKFRDKLERKKAHVDECKKRLEQLVERRKIMTRICIKCIVLLKKSLSLKGLKIKIYGRIYKTGQARLNQKCV